MHRIVVLSAAFCAVASLTVSGQGARSLTSPESSNRVARILPGTPDSAFTTIQGNALDSAGRSMPQTLVRLRDARSGRIIDSQITDHAGTFTFKGVDPGTYIVEVLGPESQILAASQLLSVNAGDALSAVVKLPFRISPFAGFLGHTASSAAVVASAAASAQVLAATVTQESSPE